MENITDADYTYAKGACKDLIKKLVKYDDFYF